MYNKLLITAGGGIISSDQQAEQENCATIAIGLGGTGISCLRALKKEVYTRVKPDDPSSSIAKYRHIKYLAVDTDKSSLGDTGSIDTLDSNTEFFNISCPDINGLLSQAHILAQNPSLNWLKTKNTQEDGNGITILSAEAGAGGIRQIGRLLLLQSAKSFVEKLTNIITEARKDLVGSQSLNIHIFTGISGGTGAGTFLDVCYLVQYVLQQLGLAGQAYTCGYFFMPDVNMANHPTDYLPINGFAAMKEIDYCMNFENNGGEWNQQYDGFSVKTSEPPVKLAHLITATDAKGQIGSNAYNYAMHVAVDYVLEYIIKPFVSENDAKVSEGAFTIKSHIANVKLHIEMVNKKHGATYNYCILGAANAYLPYKEITTYLASKIFEGFADLPKRYPMDTDIDLFVKSHKLSYNEIYRDLCNKLPTVPNIDVDHKELYDQVEGISASVIPQLLAPMRDVGNKIAGQLQTNEAALLNSGAQAPTGAAPTLSLIEKIKGELIKIAQQADKGPYYASGMLHNLNARDLRKIIVGYIAQNDDALTNANGDLGLRQSTWEEKLNDLQNSNWANRKKRANEYAQAVRAYHLQQYKIDALMKMGDLLTKFEKQLTDLHTNFFGVFATVMQNLQSTFDANRVALSNPLTEDAGYAIKLMTIQDLQGSLDGTVAAMDIPGQIHGFISDMMNTPEAWVSQDENKIAAQVNKYFLSQLGAYTSRTIDDYLKIKFDTTDPTTLQKKVYDEIITNPLGDKAAPMFWTDSGVYQLSDSKAMGYVSIPNISDCIYAAAEQYKAANADISIRMAWATDRITIYKFVCGVPLFGYKGVANYKENYKQRKIIGSHLYEGSSRDARDNRKLINVSPISCVPQDQYTPEELENIKMYDFALENGIVSKNAVGDGFEYRLNSFALAEITDCMEVMQKIIETKDVQRATAFLNNRKDKTFSVQSYRVIPAQSGDYFDLLAKDIVLGSRLNVQILSEQVAALKDYAEKEKALNELIRAAGTLNKTVHDFAMGLMTGVIKKVNNYEFAYVRETYGIEESTALTTIDSEPYGMALPLYSAYVGYCALDDEAKQQMEATVKETLMTDSEKVDSSIAETQKLIAPEKVTAILATAKTNFPNDVADVHSFYKRFAGEVTNFAATR